SEDLPSAFVHGEDTVEGKGRTRGDLARADLGQARTAATDRAEREIPAATDGDGSGQQDGIRRRHGRGGAVDQGAAAFNAAAIQVQGLASDVVAIEIDASVGPNC